MPSFPRPCRAQYHLINTPSPEDQPAPANPDSQINRIKTTESITYSDNSSNNYCQNSKQMPLKNPVFDTIFLAFLMNFETIILPPRGFHSHLSGQCKMSLDRTAARAQG